MLAIIFLTTVKPVLSTICSLLLNGRFKIIVKLMEPLKAQQDTNDIPLQTNVNKQGREMNV